MESLSKRILTPRQIDALLRESTGCGAAVERELTGGMFNSAYLVRLEDGRRGLLKLAPPPELPVLRYERGIMSTEALVYRLAAPLPGVPLPELWHGGPEHLLISLLDGVPWSELEPAEPGPLRRELGRISARLHRVVAPDGRFGYPAAASGLAADDWPTAFGLMVDAVLADAAAWRVELGTTPEEVRGFLAAGHAELASVREPRLVHFDLWPGNVFVDAERGAVTGLIDHERAFFGDPVAELVAQGLGGDTGPDSALAAGYRDEGATEVADPSPGAQLRLLLYRLYLGLIMVTECAPRGFAGEHAEFARTMLSAPLAELRAR